MGRKYSSYRHRRRDSSSAEADRLVVVIITIRAKPPGLRINSDFDGPSVLGSGGLVVSAFMRDLHVRPSIRLQLLPNLLFVDGLVACDQGRPLGLLRRRNDRAGRANGRRAGDDPNKGPIHGSLLLGFG